MQKMSDSVGVALADDARQILSRYDEGNPNDWVFPILWGLTRKTLGLFITERDSGSRPRTMSSKSWAKRRELRRTRFHLSRHAAAWQLYQKADEIYKVRDFLGHSSAEQTEE